MSSSELPDNGDKGINEVLQLTGDMKITENCEKAEPFQNGKEAHTEISENQVEKITNGNVDTRSSSSGNGNEPEVDLADPERVMQMLETVDLTEEDTEFLLQEAYKMNKKLKDMLRHQESSSSSCPPDIQRQKIKRDKISPASPSQFGGSRSESASSFSASKPLPPILCDRQTTDIYAMKLTRSRTNIPFTNNHPTKVAERAKSSRVVANRTVSI